MQMRTRWPINREIKRHVMDNYIGKGVIVKVSKTPHYVGDFGDFLFWALLVHLYGSMEIGRVV